MTSTRGPTQRKIDALAMLEAPGDTWVATVGAGPHLVPLTFDWNDPHVTIATPVDAITTRNLMANPEDRLAFGSSRDVVMMDARVEEVVSIVDAHERRAHYVARHGIDPSTWGERYAFLVLRAQRIQAWRAANEIEGRTLMRGGVWLV